MSIKVEQLRKSFGAFRAIDDVSIDFPTGKLIALLGPSGCGKTTLLRVIAGLEFPDSGRVLFNGEDASHRDVRERQVGFVFQHYALFRHMSVFENVAFGLRVKPRKERPAEAEIRKRVTDLLDLVQLGWLADRYPSQLSGGQRQRIALARALAVEPRVLLSGRAVRRIGCQGAQGAAPVAAPVARRAAHYVHFRDARPGRGTGSGRPCRADEQGARGTGRNNGRALRRPFEFVRIQLLGTVNRFEGRVEGQRLHVADGSLTIADVPDVQGEAVAYARPHDLELLKSAQDGDGLLAHCHARPRLRRHGSGGAGEQTGLNGHTRPQTLRGGV